MKPREIPRKPPISARFSFLAVTAFLLCTDRQGTALLCFSSCVLHELGHIAVMLAERRPPESVVLYGGGIKLSGGSRSLLACAGGVLTNILLFSVFYFVPFPFGKRKLFAVINLLLAAVNLLPVGELDGKLLLDKALLRTLSAEKALRISSAVTVCALVIVVPAVIILVFSGCMNPSSLIFFFYLAAAEFIERQTIGKI